MNKELEALILAYEAVSALIIKAHRQWALKQDKKPPAIPPKA
ncbi:MAG TPA: hypothetical protein VFM25_04550 [Verrucomicrobiae bacterium]|jgi:hypothetical protein|nr:hypothetical protein [Verrucomicrobiae bacterium]